MNEALAQKIEILKNHLPEIKKKFQVKELGVFGSYTYGDFTEESDIDILVQYEETPSLFGFMELENYLSEILQIHVDLVMKDGLKPRIKNSILDSTVYV